MRRLILATMFFSPAASAVLQVYNITFSNIREASTPGNINADVSFLISYRGMQSRSTTLRSNCPATIPVSASFYPTEGLSNRVVFFGPAYANVARTGPTYVTLDELFIQVTPQSAVVSGKLENAVPGSFLSVVTRFGIIGSACTEYDIFYGDVPGSGGIIPPVRPHCNINVDSHLTHGAVSLPAVGNSHVANGRLQVSCDNPADVTVSTGHTGSIKINDTLSTDISINGTPNSAKKTVNGTEAFTVSSRLYRTSNSNWGGSFSQPVVMTISWP